MICFIMFKHVKYDSHHHFNFIQVIKSELALKITYKMQKFDIHN